MRKLYVNNETGRTFDSDHVLTHYSTQSDMTFITYETENSIELVGFYFGEPEEAKTEECIGYLYSTFTFKEETDNGNDFN